MGVIASEALFEAALATFGTPTSLDDMRSPGIVVGLGLRVLPGGEESDVVSGVRV